jgi:thioredoxin-like negative regulator of GroEL
MPKEEIKLITSIDTEEQFNNKVMESGTNKLMVIDVYTEWCGPCKELIPTYKALQMNTDEFDNRVQLFQMERKVVEAFAERFPATSMPRFLLLKEGQELDVIVGVNAPKLLNSINSLMPELIVDE